MNDRLSRVKTSPFHQYLGIENFESKDGNGCLQFTVKEAFANITNVLHGGVVYTLCDVCAYTGLTSVLEASEEAVTNDINISVLRPAKLGDMVEFKSTLLKKGKRLCFIDVTASVGDKIIASARVTKSIIEL